MAAEQILAKAGGTIRCSRFVKQSTAANNTILESAAATTPIVGVSSEAAQAAPIPGASANAAVAGDACRYYPLGSVAPVTVGSGGITAGAMVISDTSGQAILAVLTGTTAQYICGIALETASAGEVASVLLWLWREFPALS